MPVYVGFCMLAHSNLLFVRCVRIFYICFLHMYYRLHPLPISQPVSHFPFSFLLLVSPLYISSSLLPSREFVLDGAKTGPLVTVSQKSATDFIRYCSDICMVGSLRLTLLHICRWVSGEMIVKIECYLAKLQTKYIGTFWLTEVVNQFSATPCSLALLSSASYKIWPLYVYEK